MKTNEDRGKLILRLVLGGTDKLRPKGRKGLLERILAETREFGGTVIVARKLKH
jgi:hypothetical protein